ncbi:MAG: hypothetical protein HKO53_15150 [Gemmatimonadetes bacterium]|nr:hypothetical protein [Gemmatimonadota bacterium]
MSLRRGTWLAALLVAAACGGDGAAPVAGEETISQEAFIEAYIALRVVGLRAPQQLISPEDRLRVLEEQGVTEEQLLEFVEVHGEDLLRMQRIWNEVESRLEELRTRSDSSDERS